MSSITDDQGLLNNFAKETKLYHAEAPSPQKQRTYLIQGIVATFLISTLIVVTVVVS